MNSDKIFVTGAAGFIGYHLCKKLLENNFSVIGLDNLNKYYDVKLKKDRLKSIKSTSKSWYFFQGSLEDRNLLDNLFKKYEPKIVINLAAQAGVRYSIENPNEYINSNIVGFSNILECCRNFSVKNLIYASSSSVYGGNKKSPFSEKDNVDHPVSIYAATKKSNEMMAHAYSHLFKIPCTGLRLFTVYGPWGRPDMAPMIFAKSIFEKKAIKVFNNGNMDRDFTYIDDVIEIIIRLIDKPATSHTNYKEDPNPSISWAPHRIFNIGNSNKIALMKFIEILEDEIGIKAIKKFEPMQMGDVKSTYADTSKIEEWIGYKPKTELNFGINKFINWYKEYNNY